MTCAESHEHSVTFDRHAFDRIEADHAYVVAALEREPRASIEPDIIRHLAHDGEKLPDRHHPALWLARNVPHLNERFRPRFRVAATIQSREAPALDLGDVVARPGLAIAVGDHEWKGGVGFQALKEAAGQRVGG